jgi:hypothetical protein
LSVRRGAGCGRCRTIKGHEKIVEAMRTTAIQNLAL